MFHGTNRITSKPLLSATLLAMLSSLSGCASINDAYSTSGGSIVPEFISEIGSKKSSGEQKGDELNQQMMQVDQAPDRMHARNAMIVQLLSESDSICNDRVGKITAHIEAWPVSIKGEQEDDFASALEKNIALRKFDKTNLDMRLPAAESSANPTKDLATAIVDHIGTLRHKTHANIENRLQMDIHRYSLKQALEDVQTYHNSCDINPGLVAVVRGSGKKMSPEERQAELESLIKLRQTLIQQGMSTRAIQNRIDAVIMAE